jgi:hypothetical protein
MANRKRWAALRYARLIAEVKRDTEVASAVEVGASNTVNQIANNTVTTVSNSHLTSTYTSNADFQSYVANTNPRFDTYLQVANSTNFLVQTDVDKYLEVANVSSVSAITDLSDVDISGATDGQVLTFNSSNNTITATTVSGGGGGGGITTGKAIAMAMVFG